MREALRHEPQRVVRVYRLFGRDDRRARQIEELCDARGVELADVAAAELDRLADGVHNGFAAELAPAGAVAPTIERQEDGAEAGFVVLIEDVQDPRNLGALIRVCDAAGVDRLLVRDRGSAQVTAAAVKTSAGAAEWLDVERVTNTAREIERLKEAGYWVYGAAADGVAPWELDLTGPVAILVGGEERGLRRLTRERCDGLVGLPMLGRVESLNLATAAAAILYEVVRQRGSRDR